MSSSVILNGKTVAVPKEFFDVGVKASFGDNVQANLSTEEFTFVLDAYSDILAWINDGRKGGPGIFEGIPLDIIKSDGVDNVAVFKGIVDLQSGATIQENLKQVQVSLRQDDGLNQLAELLEPLDYGYLKSLKVFTSADYVSVDYVVISNDNGLETITTLITVYLLSKQLIDTIKEIAVSIATVVGIATAVPAGPIGAVIYAIALAVIQILYALALLALILDFGKDLLNIVIPPKRTHKGITLESLLVNVCQYIGLPLQTTIEDLDSLVFLPSNRNVDDFGAKNILKKAGSITEGVPNISDPGYTCTEMFQIVKDLFNARFAVVDNKVQLHSENSSYWLSQSGWVKRDIRKNVAGSPYRFNTDEIKSSIFITFSTDLADEYTISNYKGTAYQVLTDAKTISNPLNKTIKNADRVNIPWALGSRKSKLNPFEKSLVPLANLFDKVARVFGGKANLAKKIKTKVGILEVSTNNHTVPKLLWMKGGRMPSNHRTLFSAKVLWEQYHVEKSFIQNGGARQRRYVENEVIPFGLSDFVTLLGNSFFKDENGSAGKVVDLEWNMSKDSATISYWIQETYTNNLQETFIEPD